MCAVSGNVRVSADSNFLSPDFAKFADSGKKLAELHVNYENQPEYPLDHIENCDKPFYWRVQKMKLSKDKTQIVTTIF